jgi:hypothetical protein
MRHRNRTTALHTVVSGWNPNRIRIEKKVFPDGDEGTLPSLERPAHVVAERELITQNREWKKKKKKKRWSRI